MCDDMNESLCAWTFVCDLGGMLALEQGPLQGKCSEEQCKAPGSWRADGRRGASHPHHGGLVMVLVWDVTPGLSPCGLYVAGHVCVRYKRDRGTQAGEMNGLDRYCNHGNLLKCAMLLMLCRTNTITSPPFLHFSIKKDMKMMYDDVCL